MSGRRRASVGRSRPGLGRLDGAHTGGDDAECAQHRWIQQITESHTMSYSTLGEGKD